jgi:alpha-L-arabinofuranosidase
VIYIESPGKLWVDQAVLLSTGPGQFKGLPLRADIAKKMQQEGLNFVRYGGSMVNAREYRWKKMIGDPDKRPGRSRPRRISERTAYHVLG